MNEEIILGMVKPYIKDSTITYDEFDQLFSILSRKEQYIVCEVLFNNGISLVDRHIAEDALVLDIDDEENLAGLKDSMFEIINEMVKDCWAEKTAKTEAEKEAAVNQLKAFVAMFFEPEN